MAMNPRVAPTTIKTVPSGMALCCMNGACFVLGTTGVTIVAIPVNVGRLVGSDGRPALLVTEVVSFGTTAVVVLDINAIVVPVLVLVFGLVTALVTGTGFADVLLFVCIVVEALGSSVAAAPCADVPEPSSETANAAEISGVLRDILMVNLVSNCYAKL